MLFLKLILNQFKTLNIFLKIFVVLSIFFGSLFRYQNLFNLGYYFDMVETQYTWGKLAFEQGIFEFWKSYPMAKHYDYPPISLVYEYFVYGFTKLTGQNSIQSFVAILKFVNWFFDLIQTIAIGYFGHFLSNRFPIKPGMTDTAVVQPTDNNSNLHPVSMGWFLAGLFYLSPTSWFVSGVWGQNDTLMVLITLVCLLMLVVRFFNYHNTMGASTKETVTLAPAGILNRSPIKLGITTAELLTSQYFLAGILLAIGFWIKQQPILLLPILGLIFIHGKSNKDILKAIFWTAPFILASTVLGLFYNSQGRKFSNPFNFITKFFGFNYPTISNWGIIANFGTIIIFIIPLGILAYLQIKESKKVIKQPLPWKQLRQFLLGFWLISTLIAIPFVIANYQRFARVTFATAIRGDSIANGATTFWGLFKNLKTSNDIVIGGNGFGLELKHAALLIYLTFVGFLLWKYLNLNLKKLQTWDLKVIFAHKLDLFQLLAIMWVHTTVYFLFFPNMHSRYLHFGVIYSLFVTFFLPLRKTAVALLWVSGLILLNIFYSLNQMLVFGSNNTDPSWVKQTIDWFSIGGRNIDAWWLSSLCLTISFVLMYAALIAALPKKKS